MIQQYDSDRDSDKVDIDASTDRPNPNIVQKELHIIRDPFLTPWNSL